MQIKVRTKIDSDDLRTSFLHTVESQVVNAFDTVHLWHESDALVKTSVISLIIQYEFIP